MPHYEAGGLGTRSLATEPLSAAVVHTGTRTIDAGGAA